MSNATLVMGWRLDQLYKIKKVDGPPKFDVNTGKPVKNMVDALFFLDHEIPQPDEPHPGEWVHPEYTAVHRSKLDIFTNGKEADYGNKSFFNYPLENFVLGVSLADVADDINGWGNINKIYVPDLIHSKATTLDKLKGFCGDMGFALAIDASGKPLDVEEPSLYLVLYCSY